MSSLFSSLISPINSERELKRQALAAELAHIDDEMASEKLARRSSVIEALQAAILSEGISKSDLYPKKESADSIKGAMKYRDPASGKEWSGRGNSPKWIKGKNKEDFLISNQPSELVSSEKEPSQESTSPSSEFVRQEAPASFENLENADSPQVLAVEVIPPISVASPTRVELEQDFQSSRPIVIPDAIPISVIASMEMNVNQVAHAT